MALSSRFALSWNPSVEYLVLYLSPLWKKQTTLPSFVYAGIPYQVLDASAGALALTMAWIRFAIVRSGSAISSIFVSTSLSQSASAALEPRLAATLRSRRVSFIAARSSAVNPAGVVVFLADLCLSFISGFLLSFVSLGTVPQLSRQGVRPARDSCSAGPQAAR